MVLPKLLHLCVSSRSHCVLELTSCSSNCLHGTPIYLDWEGWSDPNNSLTTRWGVAVTYHVGYKWIWLNQGYDSSLAGTLEMRTITDLLFSDEQFARNSLKKALL